MSAVAKPMLLNSGLPFRIVSLFMSSSMNEEELKVLKKFLTGWQMSETAFVEQAAQWTKELTRMRARGPGDAENAMRGIEQEYGIEYWTIWQLRYRLERVKKIGAGAYARIQAAYEAERIAQFNKLKSDIDKTEAIAGADSPVVHAAKTLVGEG